MQTVLGNLNKRDELYQSLLDFDAGTNPIDTFAHNCDKEDADLEAKVYQEKGFHHSLTDQEHNVVMKSGKVQKMINEGLATTAFDVWYLYDKNIYECNNDMKEFFDVLKCAKDNQLLDLNKDTIVEKIDLNDREYEFLIDEISYEIDRLKKNGFIEAITISFQQNEGKGVIVVKSACTELVSKEYFKSLTAYFEAKNLTKIKVEFTSRFVAVRPIYFKTPNVPREEKQSTIIFDRNGFLKNNQIVGFYDFDNQKNNYKVNYNPNIERELKLLQS